MQKEIVNAATGAFDSPTFDLTIDQPGRLGLVEWCNVKLVRDRNMPYSDQVEITCPEDVAAFVEPFYKDQAREVVLMLSLSTANRVKSAGIMSVGDLASCIVSPRTAFTFLCLQQAACGIWVHNHPSGNPEPSREDIVMSRRMKEAGKVMGIPIHDSIIWTEGGITSLAERGAM